MGWAVGFVPFLLSFAIVYFLSLLRYVLYEVSFPPNRMQLCALERPPAPLTQPCWLVMRLRAWFTVGKTKDREKDPMGAGGYTNCIHSRHRVCAHDHLHGHLQKR